jgi:putative pyruvate formate lyase activating enzyme
LRCFYCQNYPWSQEGAGTPYSDDGLVRIFEDLRARGCHNWNLVSPTPWLPCIAEAVERAKKSSQGLPIVYNTSGFESIQTLRSYAELVDIYLVDLRYAESTTARDASDAAAYVDRAHDALREMWLQAGPLDIDTDGLARRGMICRVLVLPGHAGEAVTSLAWLAREMGRELAVSVMAQYVPAHKAHSEGAPWDRRITKDEYDLVHEAVMDLGMTGGWIQEFEGEAPEDLIGYRMRP